MALFNGVMMQVHFSVWHSHFVLLSDFKACFICSYIISFDCHIHILLGFIFMFHVYASISLSFYLLWFMCWIVSMEQLRASTFIYKSLWRQILLSSKWKLFRVEHLCHETFNKWLKSDSNILPYHQCRSFFIFSCFVDAGNKAQGFRIFRNVLYYLSYP